MYIYTLLIGLFNTLILEFRISASMVSYSSCRSYLALDSFTCESFVFRTFFLRLHNSRISFLICHDIICIFLVLAKGFGIRLPVLPVTIFNHESNWGILFYLNLIVTFRNLPSKCMLPLKVMFY